MDVTYKDLLAMIGERELTIKSQQQEIEALKAALEPKPADDKGKKPRHPAQAPQAPA